jgi:hypothetical protein
MTRWLVAPLVLALSAPLAPVQAEERKVLFEGDVVTWDDRARMGGPVAGATIRFVRTDQPFIGRRTRLRRRRRSRVTVPREGRGDAKLPAPPPPPIEVRSDATGYFSVLVDKGVYRIEAEHPDMEPWRIGPNALRPGKPRRQRIGLWPRNRVAKLPRRGVFPPKGSDTIGEPLATLEAPTLDLAVGQEIALTVRAKEGHRYRRIIVGCNGCPLDPDANEHPSGFFRNVFCEDAPCQEDVELAFYLPGSYVVRARPVLNGKSPLDSVNTQSSSYLVFRVGAAKTTTGP